MMAEAEAAAAAIGGGPVIGGSYDGGESDAFWTAAMAARRRRMESRRAAIGKSSSPLAKLSYKRPNTMSLVRRVRANRNGAECCENGNGHSSGKGYGNGGPTQALRAKLRPRSARAESVGRLRHAREEDTSSGSGAGSGAESEDGALSPTELPRGNLAGEVDSILLGGSKLANGFHKSPPFAAATTGDVSKLATPAGSIEKIAAPATPLYDSILYPSVGRRYGAHHNPEFVPSDGSGANGSSLHGSKAKEVVSTYGATKEGEAASDECPPHGVLAVCGRRREMEDAVATVPAFAAVPCGSLVGCQGGTDAKDAPKVEKMCQLHFFGVYDGHGGAQAAIFCADRLHHALAQEVKKMTPMAAESEEEQASSVLNQWKSAFSASFGRVDDEIAGKCVQAGPCAQECGPCPVQHEPVAPETVGSTAVVTVIGAQQIVVGNCGDSRAVLLRGGEVIALSNDHKPDREDEMKRVEAAGGRVIFWNGYRILGVLAMSRAIGDKYLKPYVIAEPEVTITNRSLDDECIIMATDGLWDVMSNQEACEIAKKCLSGSRSGECGPVGQIEIDSSEDPASIAAGVLTKVALARGSGDNISVVVIDLKKATA